MKTMRKVTALILTMDLYLWEYHCHGREGPQ